MVDLDKAALFAAERTQTGQDVAAVALTLKEQLVILAAIREEGRGSPEIANAETFIAAGRALLKTWGDDGKWAR